VTQRRNELLDKITNKTVHVGVLGLGYVGLPLALVLLLGLSHNKDIDDTRESPSFEIIEHRLHLGAIVSYHDPHIAKATPVRSWPNLPPMQSVPLTPESIEAADAIVISTDHSAVDYAMLAKHARLIVDTRGVYREPRSNVIKA